MYLFQLWNVSSFEEILREKVKYIGAMVLGDRRKKTLSYAKESSKHPQQFFVTTTAHSFPMLVTSK